MIVDDFILRQIQQIADLVAAVARTSGAPPSEDLFQQIDKAYGDLGLDGDMVDGLDADTLRRTLHGEHELDALIDLQLAHAEASASSDDVVGATRRFAKAIALMSDGDARRDAAQVRLDELRG